MAMLNHSGVEKLFLYEFLDIKRIVMHEPEDEDDEHIFYIKPGAFINADKFKSRKTGIFDVFKSFYTLSPLNFIFKQI